MDTEVEKDGLKPPILRKDIINKGMENFWKQSIENFWSQSLASSRSKVAPVQQMGSRRPPRSDLDSDRESVMRVYSPEMYKRRAHALIVRRACRDCECTEEEKICISASGDISRWHENLYGFTRVVVHGLNSLCVVARTEDLERVICQIKEAKGLVYNLKNALIYEAEDLALPYGELGKMTSRSFEKPFVAVSLVPGTISGHEASSTGYHIVSAIKFLEEEMVNGATISSFDESVKTAIFTLQHLFGKKFKDNEIQVFYVKNYTSGVDMGMGSMICIEKANEIPIRGERSLMDYVSVLNKTCTCGGGSYSRKRKRTLAVMNKTRNGH